MRVDGFGGQVVVLKMEIANDRKRGWIMERMDRDPSGAVVGRIQEYPAFITPVEKLCWRLCVADC